MLEFFESIANLITSIVGFITGYLDNLISGFVYLIASMGYLSTALQFMPPVLTGAAIAVVAIAIIHIILLMS